MTDWQEATRFTSGHPYRVLVAGHAQAGKDVFADILAEASAGVLRRGLSTSEFYCRQVYGDEQWPKMLAWFKHGPVSREQLAREIGEFNQGDGCWPGARLYGEMIAAGIDLLVGIRRPEEVHSCQHLHIVTHAVWVDRTVPPDSTLEYTMSQLGDWFPGRFFIMRNYGDLAWLTQEATACWAWMQRTGVGGA